MWEACFAGRLDVCRWLIKNGALQTVRTKNNRRVTPFLAACKGGHLEIMIWLFNNGAKEDLSEPDMYNTSPFYEAANMGRLDIVRWLFGHGAASDLKTPEKRSEWRVRNHGLTDAGHIELSADRFPLSASLYASRNRIETAVWLLIHGAVHDEKGNIDIAALNRDVINARPSFIW
eukprot:CAMPEP_0171975906 /NCGR_PEP_ID=MMETSP0993-20121228/239470_1 /TAXON_ID=483369 /ORGANISM="non described non described, Strain CCMP2098" /LENGTH=174 /DNA_ID=CAMNT_0012627287 /DNA_START=263 /DNA_END=784 /DNA_ORIENTATION=-